MDVNAVVQYWLSIAPDDLKAAEHLLEKGLYPQALFFAHLYLEKVLKALVVLRTGQHAPITHNLRYLAEKGDLPLTEEQKAFLTRVTEFSLKTRYPDMRAKYKWTKEFCEKELQRIKEFAKWVKQEIKSSKKSPNF